MATAHGMHHSAAGVRRDSPSLRQNADPNPPLLFIHVPKAAGTTFAQILNSYFSEQDICPAYYVSELMQLPAEEVRRYRLVCGHFEYSIRELLDAPICLTMLREPVDRVVSYYRYIRSAPAHALHQKFSQMSLMEILEDPVERVPLSNHQTRLFGRDLNLERVRARFTGAEAELAPLSEDQKKRANVDLDLAMARLADLEFVGLAERFDDSVKLLCHTLGLPEHTDYGRANVTRDDGSEVTVSDLVRSKIEDMNTMDRAFYRFASTLFGERFRRIGKEDNHS